MSRVPTYLKVLRVACGLTQAELGSLVPTPISQQRISLLERGATPTADEIAALAAILRIPADQLFPYMEENDR